MARPEAERGYRLPGQAYTHEGVPMALVPDVARLLGRRIDQLGLTRRALASVVGIRLSTLSVALNPSWEHPLSRAQYAALAEALGLGPRAEFLGRCASANADAALRDLAVRARAAIGHEAAVRGSMPTGRPLPIREFRKSEAEAVALALQGFPHEALGRFAELATVARASGNRRAEWSCRLNAGHLLLEISRLEEADAAFAGVRAAAEDSGDGPLATFACVLLAGAQYELGQHDAALHTLAAAERGLQQALPFGDVREGGAASARPARHMLHTHDQAVPPERLWWTVLHLRTKVLVEQCLTRGPDPGRLRAARESEERSFSLSQSLGLPSHGHDLLWRARLRLLGDAEADVAAARRAIARADERLPRGSGPAYHKRTLALALAAGDLVDGELRAVSALLEAAERFARHRDARGLGPAYGEAAIQFAVHARRARSEAARRDAGARAFRFALAAAAFHPHGIVRHQIADALGPGGAPLRARADRMADVEDLLDFRGEDFAPLRPLAAGLWPGSERQAMLQNLERLGLARPPQ